MGKTPALVFALLSAGLVLGGVGVWRSAGPVNTAFNATMNFLHQTPTGPLIDDGLGTSMVGLGIFFGILTAVIIIFGGRRSNY